MPRDTADFDDTPTRCPDCDDGITADGDTCTRCDGTGEICRGDLTADDFPSDEPEPDWDNDPEVQHAREWPEYHGLI